MKIKTTLLSPTQYADMRGIYRQHVVAYLKAGKDLPGVLAASKVGRQYVLSVSNEYISECEKNNLK